MRMTVKAKLAGAFCLVIILSMIVGGIAYTKLTALDLSEQALAMQAERMKRAAVVMDDIQGQQRAQTRMILATSDKETADNNKAMLDRRDTGLKHKDELYGAAGEQGKRLIELGAVKLQRMNELFEQAGKFAILNSNNRAAEIWNSEGESALKELNTAIDAAFSEISKAPTTIENTRALLALQTTKFEAARLSRSVTATVTASTVEELEAGYKVALAQLERLKGSIGPAAAQLVTLGLLAELQVRTYHESQNKSIYVVREILQSTPAELLSSAR